MRERRAISIPGPVMTVVVVGLYVAAGYFLIDAFGDIATERVPIGELLASTGVALLATILLSGFQVVQPNQSAVVTFLGSYLGTVKATGWQWTWPLTVRRTISLRVQNFDSQMLKVNDAVGNPVEVAAVIVWRVVDTARAAFDVEDYEGFVKIQTETAVRHMASLYPYDSYEAAVPSLRANADQVMASLQRELQDHLQTAGVEVLGTQLRRLAYAPEIASEMLRRQQAEAVVAARERIVEGAVGMVDMALRKLNEEHIVELDEERKAAMVSNLMVVLTGDRSPTPVINTGSLY